MQEKDAGLYWTPHGGNGTNLMWASCHEYTSVVENEDGSKTTDSILVDLGQFESPGQIGEEKDKYTSIVPDVSALIDVPGHENDNVKAQAILLTHGHTDHFDSIFEYARMGAKLPPIYGSEYTIKLLQEGFVSRGMKWEKFIDPHIIKENDVLTLGSMTVEVVTAPHTIPGSLGFKISNPSASIFHSGDIKLEEKSFIHKGMDLSQLKRIGESGVDLAVMDACSATTSGLTYGVQDEYNICSEQFRANEGKQVVVVLPPAHVERIVSVIAAAQDSGRQIFLAGGPIMDAHLAGIGMPELLKKFPNLRKTFEEENKKNSVIITCGIHAGENDGDEHSPFLDKLREHEKYAPIDEEAVVLIADKKKVLEKFIKDVYPDIQVRTAADEGMERLYVPGHASSGDLQSLLKLLKPKSVAPVHTSEENREAFNKKAIENGWQVVQGERPVQNGDTVRVVSGQPAQIVSSQQEHAFCFAHQIKETPIEGVGMKKDIIPSETYDRLSYEALGITGRPAQKDDVKERRRSCEANKKRYRKLLAGKKLKVKRTIGTVVSAKLQRKKGYGE